MSPNHLYQFPSFSIMVSAAIFSYITSGPHEAIKGIFHLLYQALQETVEYLVHNTLVFSFNH